MSTYTNTFSFDISNTTNWQALTGAIDDELQNLGWQLASDTGQTDPQGASAPAANTDAGFRIYQSNDAFSDYYVKITYGRGAGNNVRLKVDVGTGTDGAGTLTGQVATQLTLTCGTASGTHRLHLAGDAGRMMIALAVSDTGNSNNPVAVAIGRTCDTTGAFDGTGIEIWGRTASNGCTWQYVPFSGSISTQRTGGWPAPWTQATPMTDGPDTFVTVPLMFAAGFVGNPTRHVLVHDASSFTPNTATIITIYGGSHTYLVMGVVNGLMGYTSSRPMLFYE